MLSYGPLLKTMENQKLNKKQLVELTHMSWNTMSKISKNEYISMEVIDKICKVLHCQLDDIIQYIDEPEDKDATIDARE